MRPYVIERAGDLAWVLRFAGSQHTMISGPTEESAREQAFECVRQWAPCQIRVIGEPREEWALTHPGGEWERTA